MVPLSNKIKVEEALKNSPKANALYLYLTGKEVKPIGHELNDADKVYYSVLDALSKNNSGLFAKVYGELSQRRVLKEQPIIYDNYLLFALINGILKFKLSDEWIKKVLQLRDTSNEPERAITISFLNILSKNYLTKEGASSVVLAALIKVSGTEINEAVVRNSLESNKTLAHFVEKDLFIASIYMFTEDYIVSVSIGEDAIGLKRFESVFLRRITLLQNILYLLILLLLIGVWFYLIKRYPRIKEFANDLGVLLQLIGIGLLAFGLNKIKSQFGRILKLFFGYKKEANDNKGIL